MIEILWIVGIATILEGIYCFANRKNVKAIGNFALSGTILAIILVG